MDTVGCAGEVNEWAGCFTIDGMAKDVVHYWQLVVPRAKTHFAFSSLALNLAYCLQNEGSSARIAHIVGHGNDGFVVVNVADISEPVDFIGWWNPSFWHEELRIKLQRASIVKIWACHPGTWTKGVDLLVGLRAATGATCMGLTGFLYYGPSGISIEAGSTWQVAEPNRPDPLPIKAPTEHVFLDYREFTFAFTLGRRAFRVADVIRVEIFKRSTAALRLEGAQGADIFRLIDLREAVSLPGKPLALVTARVEFTLPDREGVVATFTFDIYNDRLALERTSGQWFRCSAYLQELLAGL